MEDALNNLRFLILAFAIGFGMSYIRDDIKKLGESCGYSQSTPAR